MRRAVFLDRDGALNRALVRSGKPRPPSGPAELEILPGVPEGCSELRARGFFLVVVTNQPDVARGTLSREAVEAVNASLRSRVPVDDIRVCYHDDADGCACRKPGPGLLLGAAREWAVDPTQSFMVGDRWRDIEAGRRAGCRTVLIGDGYGESLLSRPDYRTRSFPEAVTWILEQAR